MRILTVLIFCAALWAQDPKEPAPAPVPAKAKLETLQKQLEEIAARLASPDPEVRAKAMTELRELVPGLENQVVSEFHVETRDIVPGAGMRVVIGGLGGGSETMNGTWKEDGRTGTYSLKSLGDGTYELKAKLEGEGETAKVIEDKGLLADLRKKHPFLKDFMVLSPVPFRFGVPAEFEVKVRPGIVGVRVRPPSEELRHHLELVAGAGLVIDHVLPGSRAEKLGLRRFDILTRIDGEVVEDRRQVKRLMEPEVTLEYVRRAQKRRLVTPKETADK